MIIRLEPELNFSSLRDVSLLEEAKMTLGTRSGSATLKKPIDSFHPFVKEIPDVVCNDPPSLYTSK